jgi:putative ABC transport system permease protein
MMDNRRSLNRTMFWRVLRRSVFANRGRLFVILLALGAGAAITAALLNLQVDAKRRITTEFRSFGSNVVVSQRTSQGTVSNSGTFSASILRKIWEDAAAKGENASGKSTIPSSFLYIVGDVATESSPKLKVVVVGAEALGLVNSIVPTWKFEPANGPEWNGENCLIGSKVAARLHTTTNSVLHITLNNKEITCSAAFTILTGGPEDDQVFATLGKVQRAAALQDQISLIQINVPGTPQQIQNYIATLQQKFPEVDVRPIRQFTEGEARLYTRISGILSATVAVVLILTALCVMAAMTNVAMERKNDVGLMKAIGGSVRRVLRLFLAEAALLGLAGGLIGAAIGIVISIGLGKAVFGVAAQPRLIVYPISVALTVIVAILAAYPLRRLVHIRPASVFRGEE